METPRFFGRESELSRLENLLESVLNGHGQTAFIAGEAGTGKTALVEAFIERAQRRSSSLLVTMTTCDSQTGQSDPYLPFLETLSQLTGDANRFKSPSIKKTNKDRLHGVASVMTKALIEDAPNLIGSLIPGGSFIVNAVRFSAEKAGWIDKLELALKQAKLEGKIESEKMFQLYTDLLLTLSNYVGLIIVLDDLQWVDPSSTQMLFHLSRRIADAPIFLIGTYRPNDLALGRTGERHPMEPVLNELKRRHGDIIIELGKETESERKTFIDSLIDAEPNLLGEEFRKSFLEHTNGHALFSRELFKSFQERGLIVHDTHGDWMQRGEIDWNDLPPRVEGIIEERINRLGEELRETISVASVQGENFLAQIVARLQGVNDRKLLKTLSGELEKRHGLVKEDDTTRIGGQRVTQYHFSHNLFQQYLYQELSNSERMNLHADVGEMIEDLYGDRKDDMAVQLGYHFAEAEEWEKAIPYYLAAAHRSLKVSSYDSAFKLLRQALEKTGELKSENAAKAELEIHLAIGSIHQALKGYTHPDVEETFTKAYELATDSSRPAHRAAAIYGLWQFNLFKLNLDQAVELAREIEAIGETKNDSILKVIAFRALANVYYQQGNLAKTIENANKVVDNYDLEKVGGYAVPLTYDPKVFALGQRSWAESIQGYFEKAKETKAEMFLWAAELNHPISTCVAYLSALKLEYNLMDGAAIKEHSDEIRKLAKEHSFPWYLAFGEMFGVWYTAMYATEIEDTAGDAETLESTYNERVAPDGSLLIHSQFCRMISEVLLKNGRLDDAVTWVSRGIEIAEAKNDKIYLAEMLRIKGLTLLQKGDNIGAIEQINKSVSVAEANGHKLFELRARISLCQALKLHDESTDEAIAKLKILVESFPASSDNVDLKSAQELI